MISGAPLHALRAAIGNTRDAVIDPDGAKTDGVTACAKFWSAEEEKKRGGGSTALVLSVATSRRNRFVPNEGAADSQGYGCRRAAIPAAALGRRWRVPPALRYPSAALPLHSRKAVYRARRVRVGSGRSFLLPYGTWC